MGGRPAIELRVVEGGNPSDDTSPEPDSTKPGPGEEREWVERARTHDEQAWSRLYRAHYDEIYRYVLYLHGDAPSTEDLVQETFVRAMKGIRGFRAEASFTTWLHRIALNVVRRHWRRTRSRRSTAERFAVISADRSAASPEDRHTDEHRARALMSALERLPPKLREAFVLRDLMGMASSEAAQLLGISPGHLAVRGHRARTKLRELLAQQGWAEPKEETSDGA